MKRWIHSKTDPELKNLSREDQVQLCHQFMDEINEYGSEYGLVFEWSNIKERGFVEAFGQITSIPWDNLTVNPYTGTANPLISTYNSKWKLNLYAGDSVLFMPSIETLDQSLEKAKSNIDKFLATGEQFSEECRRYEETGTAPESQASMARRAAQYGLKYYAEEVASFADHIIKGITEYSDEFSRIPEVTASGLQQSINNVIYDRYFQYFKSNPDSYDGPPNRYDQMEDYIDKYHAEYIKIKSTSAYTNGSIIVTVTEYFREATLNTVNYCIYDGVDYCSDRINKKTFNSLRDDVVVTID